MAAIDRRRHARQLLLTEIGEQGQARLCATRVTLSASGDPRAARVARDYLDRAGLQLLAPAHSLAHAPAHSPAHAPAHSLAHSPAHSPAHPPAPALSLSVATPAAIRTLAGRPELEPAAAALAGAFAAVEAIKEALGLSQRAALPAQLSLAEPSS